ncbi:MAG: hypothetical protein APR63_11860 [Desulfuromonas sp. SDB]|nr:MAG: hypothetical protein APR63_11860 [Desulfuromonas sp. SDB]
MNQKQFFNNVSNDKFDVIDIILDALEKNNIDYCIIGGLAVNAYVEPVVSLDLDIIITADKINDLVETVRNIFSIEKHSHSINLNSEQSDLRIQIQTDQRYQDFITRSSIKNILGYKMKVAALKDILKGKIWAYSDPERRMSKRQKDLADIMRIVENYPELKNQLPQSITNNFL